MHWATCFRRILPHFVVQYESYTNFVLRERLNYNANTINRSLADLESIENIIVVELAEVMSNYTLFDKYTRSFLTTLKIVLHSGFEPENSDSIYTMVID